MRKREPTPALIPVSSARRGRLCALIDPDLLDLVSRHAWQLNSRGYPASSQKAHGLRSFFALHHPVLAPPDGRQVDHISGDTLDDHRTNLRLVTNQQNQFNPNPNGDRRFKGVYRNSKLPYPVYVRGADRPR